MNNIRQMAEKVIKGLECCEAKEEELCYSICPYREEGKICTAWLAHDALYMINSYKQIIEWAFECGFNID